LQAALVHALERTQLKSAEAGVSAAAGQRGHHHDRHRQQPHHLFEEVQPVHPGHFDVEGHDVRVQRLDRGSGLERIGGLADHQELRVVAQGVADHGAHGGAIIHHQDAYGCGHPMSGHPMSGHPMSGHHWATRR